MQITYHIEDGYAGGSRPHHVKVDDGDLEECETEQEKIEVIEDAIQSHFEQNISWYWDRKIPSK